MLKREGPFQDWDRNTRMPTPPPPPKSCDCQFHIYEDPKKYPPSASSPYPPISNATFGDALKMHRALGFERGVIVHSTVYHTDHRLLLDTLEGLDPATRKNYRATSIIDDSISDRELERLNAAGVCAARLNIAKMFGQTPSKEAAQRTIDRIRGFGWHVRVHVRGNDLLEYSEVLRSIKDIPMVIDHLGHVDLSKGVDQAVCRWILDVLKNDNWWMMVSNGNRDSKMDRGWDDAIPFGKAYISAAPDRIIWSTDWPHPMWTKRMMNDAEEVELLYRYADNDRDLLQKILVKNPARLHGFSD